MIIVIWIIPFKSFKKSTKSQTKIKKFNMVNLFSITFRATTFLRDMITNNEQKDPMSTFCFWEKILLTFWWFYSTLEGTSFYSSVNKAADSNNWFFFWTSSVHIYQSLQFQIKTYVICWLWFQLENKQKWQEFLIFICKYFSFIIICDYADTLSLFFMISETLSKIFQL